MKRRVFIVIVALGILVAIGLPLSGVLNATTPVSVTTQRYNLSRNSVNTSETILNVANVKTIARGGTANNFGKLFSDQVDGDIYTQPLIMTGISIPGKGTHNVVYVATMHNTVYAFDADKVGPPLWSKNLGVTWTGDCRACASYPSISTTDIAGGEDGVLATPVIDPSTRTMYLVSHHDGVRPNGAPPTHVLHALDISTGAEKFGGPVVISAQVTNAFGSTNVGGVISYDAGQHLQRTGLALYNGKVIFGMGSTADNYPFFGWLFAYTANNLNAAPAVWLTSPQGWGSGLWMAGSGPVIDSSGYIYITTGNGDYSPNSQDATHSPLGDYGDSVVKLKLDTVHNVFNVIDYFTPWNQRALDQTDADLGSSNFMLIPGTHQLFGGGKHDTVYLLNTNDMGQYVCTSQPSLCVNGGTDVVSNNDTQLPGKGGQEWTGKNSHLHNTPNAWTPPSSYCANCQLIYVFSEQDMLKAYKFVPGSNGTGSFPGNPPIPVSSNGQIQNFGMPSGMVTISSNGSTAGTGIAWTTDWKSNFRAVDATDLTKILWTDQDSPRDGIGVTGKFVAPVVANGKVYMATRSGRLTVYGLLPTTPAGGLLNGSIVTSSPASVNLTTEGTLDWAHWGLVNNTSFDHKMGATGPVGMISPILAHGTGPLQYSGSATSFTWSDGTPTATQSPTNTGVYVAIGTAHQEVSAVQFTVPADKTPRILKVYVALTNAQANFRASLSDGSAADFTETTTPSNFVGTAYRVYTLLYQAATDNQQLFVTWSLMQDNGSGNVKIQAASLMNYLPPDGPPQPTFQPPTNTPFAATSTITPTPGPSPTPTLTPTPLPPDSFRVKYQALNIRDTELQIRAAVNVVNLTSTAANMTEFKLRYYFTKDGGGTLAFTCETAVINCSKVHGAFAAINPAVAGADTYLELTFDSQSLPQSGGSSGAIQFHITKSDNSTFTQTDDFSYDGTMTTFADSRRIAMYRNNTLIWGTLPNLVAPVLTSPADGITGLTSHPTLQWTGNDTASRYQVKVVSGTATVFLQWYSASSVCSGTACSVSPNVTLPNGLYTWFVETGTPSQNGPWSTSRTFKVGP